MAACLLSFFVNSFGQANGSFYTLQLGKKTCLFKYQLDADTMQIRTSPQDKKAKKIINHYSLETVVNYVKDTIVPLKYLTLMDTSAKEIHTRYPLKSDTVTGIDPVTLRERTSVVNYNDASFHIETTMSYFDFLLLLKSKFELKNPQKNYRVYSYNIYYETQTEGGRIDVQYPQASEGVISKLNCLAKDGGFVLLSINEADHGLVKIDTGNSFLALIKIKN